MPDLIAPALAQPALGWLAGVALLAGLVRGFSGFGTAMVYMPVAGQVLNPFGALVTLTIMDIIGPLPNVPRALRDGERGDVALLTAGLIVAMPLGLALLGRLPGEAFRYGVSLIALLLVVLLASGFRYHGRLTRPLVAGAGALGGFLGGLTGLAGPPAIMLYMASSRPAAVIRANLMLYLVAVDLTMVVVLWLAGRLEGHMVVLGLGLALPYLVGNVVGGWLFRPGRERLYRLVAYAIITVSALSGLPLFDAG